MQVDGRDYRTIWFDGSDAVVIDQTRLPHELVERRWRTVEDAVEGIASMQVRGAPLIGVAAAHGLALAMRADPSDGALDRAAAALLGSRPTAVNLRWAVERVADRLRPLPPVERADEARCLATELADEDVATNRAIGEHALDLVLEHRRGDTLQVMTHCNAGWLATVDWGTALAPVYLAHQRGIRVHVWVSETRPRLQGAALTAWELAKAGVPHTLVVDNAAGLLIANDEVDCVVVGADRVAANGDVVNKVGTVLKALAAADAGVPFYVLAPSSTIDERCPTGADVPIEERGAEEVTTIGGIPVAPEASPVRNWGFDVTPARLVRAVVTEHGARRW